VQLLPSIFNAVVGYAVDNKKFVKKVDKVAIKTIEAS
jgi:hypothetical protein